jgi:hypothetical protein
MASDTHIQHEPAAAPSAEESLRRGHELRDAHMGPIIKFMVILVVATAVIHTLLLGMEKFLKHENEKAEPVSSPFAQEDRPAPPGPLLQPSPSHPQKPSEDMEALRAEWHKALTTYGRVEGQPERARIPIERAINLAVAGKLPRASTQPSGATTRGAGGGR